MERTGTELMNIALLVVKRTEASRQRSRPHHHEASIEKAHVLPCLVKASKTWPSTQHTDHCSRYLGSMPSLTLTSSLFRPLDLRRCGPSCPSACPPAIDMFNATLLACRLSVCMSVESEASCSACGWARVKPVWPKAGAAHGRSSMMNGQSM